MLNSKTDVLCRWHAAWKAETFHCWNLEPVLTCLTASILLLCHRNPNEKSEIAAEKEQKQRCWETSGTVSACQKAFMPLPCQWAAKFVINRASSQSHPVAGGGLPAIQQHLYAGYHHLLLPVCKTTCYQKVPLWSKDITSKYIFTSRKQITQRLLVSAICFLNHSKLQV